jgi:hypothetical protein
VLFKFFCDVPAMIATPQIVDRADRSKYIDQYVSDFSESQKRTILQARDYFLIRLEDISDQSSWGELLQGGLRERAGPREQYLFDSRIPVLTESDARLRIQARTTHKDGFRTYDLDAKGVVDKDRRITFSARLTAPHGADLLKWKVKNDNASPEPRGEITDHTTRNNPERTKYKGEHFVECYAVRQNVCIAKSRQNIVIS